MTHHARHERREEESEEQFFERLAAIDRERRQEHEGNGKHVVDVKGDYKHMHMFKHHGRYEHEVPHDFFPNSQGQFSEPGGEEVVFTYPEGCQVGDILNIQY